MIKSHTCLVIYQGYWFKIKTDSVFAEWSFSVLLSSWAVFSFPQSEQILPNPQKILRASENSVIFLTSVACLLTCSLLSQGSPVHQNPDFLCLTACRVFLAIQQFPWFGVVSWFQGKERFSLLF